MWPQSWVQGRSMPSIVDSGTLNHASFDTHLLSMRGRYPGLHPRRWTQDYAACGSAAGWLQCCISKSTGVSWPIEECRLRRL